MHTPKAILALLVALAFVPLSAAELTFTPSAAEAPELSWDGAQELKFTATLTCDEFVMGENPGMSQTRTVAFGYPVGFTGDASVDVTFDGSSCVPDVQGSVDSAEQTINITPGAGAAGMAEMQVNLTSGDDTGSVPFSVAYRPGYTLDIQQEFPVTVTKDPETGEWIPVEFTGTISLTPNANTMIMTAFPSDGKAQYGLVEGVFGFKTYRLTQDQMENGITETVTFRYTPTAEGWEEDTVTFTTWSHYLEDGDMKTDDEVVTWTFVNGAPEEDNGIPGPGIVPVGLALMGAALVAARRRQ